MIRRIVCLLLVPALLANQAAMCCAHHHHGLESDDHPARNHVHLFGHYHQTDGDEHQHFHDETCDHRHSGEQNPNEDASDSDFDASCPADHDSDAIFFGEQDSLQVQTNRLTFGVSIYSVFSVVAELPRAVIADRWSRGSRAGPFLPYHCAIYLQTRSLLI